MPLEKPNLQPTLFELGEMEDERTPEEVQQRGDQFRGELLERVLVSVLEPEKLPENGGAPAWAGPFLKLLDQGWDWRKATYIAWAATPKINRWPRSQEALAKEMLGLNSDRVISTWRSKNPAIEAAISALQTAELFEHRGAVLGALKESAANSDYKHHPDRKLYLEMIGDYIPVAQLRQLLMSGKLRLNKEPADYSDEELEAIARVAGEDWVDLITIGGAPDDGSDTANG